MKIGFVKVLNILLVLGILFGYQYYMRQRNAEIAAYEAQVEEAEQAWADYYASNALGATLAKANEPASYENGAYVGSAYGFGGEIVVNVVIWNGEISSCEVSSAENETAEYLSSALAVLDAVVEQQSADVDTVSGATISSTGILNAVAEALEQAVKEE